MSRERGRIGRRQVAVIATLASAWLLAVHVLVPWLIRMAYFGGGPAFLRGVITGQAEHTVDRYLSFWGSVAWKLHAVVLAVVALYLARRRIVAATRRMVRADPAVGARDLVATALLGGVCAGIAEGLHIALAKSFNPLGSATFDQSLEALWMAPLGEAAMFLAAGLVIAAVTRAWRHPVSLRLVTGLALFAASYAVIRQMRLGIGIWPVRVLALGLAAQASSMITARADAFRRRLPSLLAIGGVWVVGSGSILHGSRVAREWLAVRSLPSATAGAPNVVFIILDTVRAQSLSLYGYDRSTTPRLARLAGQSVVFDRAIAPTSWSLPSHASVFTGRLPTEVSARWNRPLDATYPTLAQVLAGRGYATAGFVANFYYAGRPSGVTRGMAHVEDVPISLAMIRRNAWWARKFQLSAERRRTGATAVVRDAATVVDGFLRWSAKRGGRPYFAFLNFMDAHSPYEAPDSIRARFGADGPNALRRGTTYTPAQLLAIRASYDAAIAYIDEEIGRIADSLEARGDLDRTILIVTADHGEQFGEREPDIFEHGNSLYAPAVHVPLLIRYPPALPDPVRVARSIAIRRLPDTVLHLLDASAESPFPGESLAIDANPAARAQLPAPVRLVLRPSSATWATEPLHRGLMASVVWRRWQYIRNGDGQEELYDFAIDPWERDDRSADPALADTLARLRGWADPPASIGAAGGQDESTSGPSAPLPSSLVTAARSAGSTK